MKLLLPSLRTPIVEFRSALAGLGLRTREDYDELVHASIDCDARLNLCQLGNGQLIRCFISVEEARLMPNGLELFNALALEGHPVVAFGAGRGQTTIEFEWLHPDGAHWRDSAQRVELFMQLLCGHLGPKPVRARPTDHRRFSPEILDGVLAHVITAA